MNLSKFPVISKNGNEYLIKIKEYAPYNIYHVYLYKPYINIFGKRKFKKVFSSKKENFHYGFNWEDDFIEIAKDFIETYENKNNEKENNLNSKKENIEKFKKWDGKC